MEQVLKQALDGWSLQIKTANKVIESLSDEQLAGDIAPGKNSGVYLLGHLVTVHDGVLPLMGLGDKIFPEMENVFLRSPDKSGLPHPDVQTLRRNWLDINEKLNEHFAGFSLNNWMERHTAVSEEAFANEPHRNKLNILVSRTSHLAYHLGQIALLK
jgi:hypothetical protein